VAELNNINELASGPPTLKFESPPPVILPLADEPRMADDVSPQRAGPKEKNVEISVTPR